MCFVPQYGKAWIPPLTEGKKRVDMLTSKLFWLHFIAREGTQPSHEHIPDTNWAPKAAQTGTERDSLTLRQACSLERTRERNVRSKS